MIDLTEYNQKLKEEFVAVNVDSDNPIEFYAKWTTYSIMELEREIKANNLTLIYKRLEMTIDTFRKGVVDYNVLRSPHLSWEKKEHQIRLWFCAELQTGENVVTN